MPLLHRHTVRHNTAPGKRPDIDTGFALNTIWTVTTIVETALLAKGTLFQDRDEKVFIRDPEHPRHIEGRLEVGYYRALGHTRAHRSLYYPLEGLREIFDAWSTDIGAWAMRAKYMRETTHPFLERQRQTIQTDNEHLSTLQSALHRNGAIDQTYVNNFKTWARLLKMGSDEGMYDGIGVLPELGQLSDLLQSICEEGNNGCTSVEATAAGTVVEPRKTKTPDPAINRYHTSPQKSIATSPSRTRKKNHSHSSSSVSVNTPILNNHSDGTNDESRRRRRHTSIIASAAIPTRGSSKKATASVVVNAIDLTSPVLDRPPPQPAPVVTTTTTTTTTTNTTTNLTRPRSITHPTTPLPNPPQTYPVTSRLGNNNTPITPPRRNQVTSTSSSSITNSRKGPPSSSADHHTLTTPRPSSSTARITTPQPQQQQPQPQHQQPQWLLTLSNTNRHPPSRLHVHPNDKPIYAQASRLANRALARLQCLIEEVEGYATLAEEMKAEYEVWARKVGVMERAMGMGKGMGKGKGRVGE